MDWREGGSLLLRANRWNWIFPNGDSSFQFNKQAICLRTKWLSNFWTVDGCLCAPTLVHTHKATQASVLHACQTHSWLACCASLPWPPILLHLGSAQQPPAHLASQKCTGSEQALSTHYLSLGSTSPLGSTVPSAHTHQGSLLFSPPSRKHCSLAHAPSNNAKRSLEVLCSMILPL